MNNAHDNDWIGEDQLELDDFAYELWIYHRIDAGVKIVRCYRNYLSRKLQHRNDAASIIQKWYVARSYHMRGVVYKNSEKQYLDIDN